MYQLGMTEACASSMRMLRIKLILFQKDYFAKRKRVFNNIRLVINNKINYLPLVDVLSYWSMTPKGARRIGSWLRMVRNLSPFQERGPLRPKKEYGSESIR